SLYDTRLEPSHFSMALGPVNAVPDRRLVGGRTRAILRSHLHSLLSRLAKQSRKEGPSGSLLAFARGDVALRLNPYPLHYRAAFAFSTILCPHPQRHSLRFACPEGQRYGFTMFHLIHTVGLGCAFSPVAFVSVHF